MDYLDLLNKLTLFIGFYLEAKISNTSILLRVQSFSRKAHLKVQIQSLNWHHIVQKLRKLSRDRLKKKFFKIKILFIPVVHSKTIKDN